MSADLFTGSSSIDFAPLVVQAVQAVAVGALGLFGYWLNGHVQDENARKALLDAAENAVAHGLQRVEGATPGTFTVDHVSPVLAYAVGYMKDALPGALDRLGVSDKALVNLLIAKLPPVQGSISDAQIAQIASSVHGSGPPPAVDYGKVAEAVGPMIQQAVAAGLAAHYTAKPTPPTAP